MNVKQLFLWFLFILCIHALPTLALPRPILQGRTIHVRRLHTGGDHETFKLYGAKHEVDYSSKGQRGKGGIGGSNVDHQPRSTDKSSSPSVAVRPQQATFALTLVLLFQLL